MQNYTRPADLPRTSRDETAKTSPASPAIDRYLSDIAFAAKEAAETQNPSVKAAAIKLLVAQIEPLTSIAGGMR